MYLEKTKILSWKSAQYTLTIIDSQSLSTTRVNGLLRFDGIKKKRHIVVDSLGNIVSNLVHPEYFNKSRDAQLIIKNFVENTFGIENMYADYKYRCNLLIDNINQEYNFSPNKSPKIKDSVENTLRLKRWLNKKCFEYFKDYAKILNVF